MLANLSLAFQHKHQVLKGEQMSDPAAMIRLKTTHE